MKIKFLKNAQFAGQAFRKGDVADLPDVAAKEYCRTHQAEAMEQPQKTSTPSKRKTVKRSGKPAETASQAAGEKR